MTGLLFGILLVGFGSAVCALAGMNPLQVVGIGAIAAGAVMFLGDD